MYDEPEKQFDAARDDYRRLAEVSPEAAERYSYLGQASEAHARASAGRDKGKTMWDEEEELNLD